MTPAILKDQQAAVEAEPELDAVGKAYQEQIAQQQSHLASLEGILRACRVDVVKQRAKLRKLNRRFQEHCDEMKP